MKNNDTDFCRFKGTVYIRMIKSKYGCLDIVPIKNIHFMDKNKKCFSKCESCNNYKIDIGVPYGMFEYCSKGHWEGRDNNDQRYDHWSKCRDYLCKK